MLAMARRSRLAVLVALASLAVLAAVVCPCAPLPAPAAAGTEHDCCRPEAGISAATSSCCAPDSGAPRVSTPVPNAPSPAALPAAGVFESDGLAHPALAVLAAPILVRPPLILRI